MRVLCTNVSGGEACVWRPCVDLYGAYILPVWCLYVAPYGACMLPRLVPVCCPRLLPRTVKEFPLLDVIILCLRQIVEEVLIEGPAHGTLLHSLYKHAVASIVEGVVSIVVNKHNNVPAHGSVYGGQ